MSLRIVSGSAVGSHLGLYGIDPNQSGLSVAAYRVGEALRATWTDVKKWWYPSAGSSVPSRVSSMQRQIAEAQEKAFDDKLQKLLQSAVDNWSKASVFKVAACIEERVQSVQQKDKEEALILDTLHENLSADEMAEIAKMRQLLRAGKKAAKAKRSLQQVQPLVTVPSTPQYVFPVQGKKDANPSLAVCGRIVLYKGIDQAGETIQLYFLTGNILQKITPASLQAAFQGPPIGYSQISCSGELFDVIEADNISAIYHTRIAANGTVILSTYRAITGLPPVTRAPIPATLTGGTVAVAVKNGAYLYYPSDPTGQLGGSDFSLYTPTTPLDDIVVALDDGSTIAFTTRNTAGVYASRIYPNNTIYPAIDVHGGTSLYPLMPPRTPAPALLPFDIASSGTTGITPTICTYDPVQDNITSTTVLSTEPSVVDSPSVGCCGDLCFYARASNNGQGWSIVYDFRRNGTSLTSGEQVLAIPSMTSPTFPQVGLSVAGPSPVGVATYIDANLNARIVTVTLVPPGSDVPVQITITIPPTLTQTFVPITSQLISFSNNTASILLVDANGFNIVFSANYSSVPVGVPFSPLELYNFSISRGNSTGGFLPVFIICSDAGICNISPPLQTEPEVEANLSSLDPKIIGFIVGGCFAALLGVAATLYFAWFRPRQARIRAAHPPRQHSFRAQQRMPGQRFDAPPINNEEVLTKYRRKRSSIIQQIPVDVPAQSSSPSDDVVADAVDDLTTKMAELKITPEIVS